MVPLPRGEWTGFQDFQESWNQVYSFLVTWNARSVGDKAAARATATTTPTPPKLTERAGPTIAASDPLDP